MDQELGDIIVVLDMDGPTFIPWTDPADPWPHIPDTLNKLVKEGLCGKKVSLLCATFNPSMHKSQIAHNLRHLFVAGRYGAHHDWISEGHTYDESFRDGKLKKSAQILDMLTPETLKQKLVIFVDDDLENCTEVAKTLAIPCVYLPNHFSSKEDFYKRGDPYRGITVEILEQTLQCLGDRKTSPFIFCVPL